MGNEGSIEAKPRLPGTSRPVDDDMDRLFEHAEAVQSRKYQAAGDRRVVPVTLLTGFLGAGKTTLLKRILENKRGLKVGCLVNDLASINVDANLVAGSAASGADAGAGESEIVAMQNGCLCCDGSQELVDGLVSLLKQSEQPDKQLDFLIIEATGMAEPARVRVQINTALIAHKFANLLYEPSLSEFGTVVTVVDASSVHQMLASGALGGGGGGPKQAGSRPVGDLLLAQVEEADVVLLNKTDLLAQQPARPGEPDGAERRLALLSEAVASCARGGSGKAVQVHVCNHCDVPLELVLQKCARGDGSPGETHAHKGHDHEGHDHEGHVDHSHSHDHEAHAHKGHDHEEHVDHSHSHDHEAHAHKGHDHEGHDHEGHDHEHEGDDHAACGHDHDHAGHDHEHSHTEANRAASEFGMHSITFSSDLASPADRRHRPFVQARLMSKVLRFLPSVDGGGVNWQHPEHDPEPLTLQRVLASVVRSKGYVWLAEDPDTAYVWAQAGSHSTLTRHGPWQTTVEHGDGGAVEALRRQGLVFIGLGLQGDAAKLLEAALEECLADEVTMAAAPVDANAQVSPAGTFMV